MSMKIIYKRYNNNNSLILDLPSPFKASVIMFGEVWSSFVLHLMGVANIETLLWISTLD